MWRGRFSQPTSNLVAQFTESISYDWRLYPHDIRGSLAHAAVLLAAGILTQEEHDAIAAGLEEIRHEIETGAFPFDPALEDIHMNIEAALTRKIGPPGAKLHTARSRNDQVATDFRLYVIHEADTLSQHLRTLQSALVALGEKYPAILIPGYTHLQRAQPVLLAHHLLAYVEMLHRDLDRFADTRRRAAVLPLGSGAIAGSTILLDRTIAARHLGLPEITRNSMDAVSDRDFAADFLYAAALTGAHLSRLSEDIILWTSAEFAFITLSDAHTTGSSLMPQKKNPDVAELTRGKTGRLYGNLVSLLTTLKGLPMTYNRDLQEDKLPLFDSADTLRLALPVLADMILQATVNLPATQAAVADANLLATDLADYLVLRGVPFRHAHEHVGRAVARCAELKTDLRLLPLAEYQAITPHFASDLYNVLDLDTAMAARRATGAPSPANVRSELTRWRQLLPLEG